MNGLRPFLVKKKTLFFRTLGHLVSEKGEFSFLVAGRQAISDTECPKILFSFAADMQTKGLVPTKIPKPRKTHFHVFQQVFTGKGRYEGDH